MSRTFFSALLRLMLPVAFAITMSACNQTLDPLTAGSGFPVATNIGPPAFTFQPTALDFGVLAVGLTSGQLSFTATNASAGPVSIGSVTGSNSNFTITSDNCPRSPAQMAPGATCKINVVFNPTTGGTLGTSVSINYGLGGTSSGLSSSAAVAGRTPSLQINPTSKTIAVNNVLNFSASGGVTPYVFSVLSGGGTIVGSTYTAPAATGTATVRVTDAAGTTADCPLTINGALAISPAAVTILINSSQIFSASGGAAPYTFSLISGPGSMTGNTYNANAVAGTATVRVTDAAGNTSNATVTVNNALTITPTSRTQVTNNKITFSGVGGIPPYTYSVTAGGGAITVGGVYTAPGAAGAATVQVKDSTNATATAAVTIIAVSQVVASGNTTCARFSDGTMKCWGNGNQGQLGNSSIVTQQITPVSVTGISNATSIAGGAEDTTYYTIQCAIVGTGSVKCWGVGTYGTLGTGGTSSSAVPVSVSGITTATQISVGILEACAVLTNNTVQCWGYNPYGGVGDNTTTQRNAPVAVSGINTATQVANGNYFACARLTTGAVNCWGYNSQGNLGNGTLVDAHTPVAVTGITTATQVAAGYYHACALLANQTVQCWGYNGYGQLGNSTNVSSSTPVTVTGINNAVAISAGYMQSCALLATGDVQCWGWGSEGELGQQNLAGSNVPVTIPGLTPVASISAGYHHVCALQNDNNIKCWGDNSRGELGTGFSGLSLTTTPAMTGVTTATQIASSKQFNTTCVVLANGTVKCAGYNYYVTLGDGSPFYIQSAQDITTVQGITTATQVAVGYLHACALLSDNSVRCWGYNPYGNLGNGTAVSANSPVIVTGLTTATQIATGNYHTCAVTTSNTLKCWGYNGLGQLGIGNLVDQSVPTTVPGITNALQVAGGALHTCAVLLDGTVWCWGQNLYGQLGNGTTTNSSSPVQVPGITTAIAVDTGSYASCALLMSGVVQCWGDGYELGTGTTLSSTTPISVGGITSATKITIGNEAVCALMSNGTLQCWGYNDYGEVGSGNLVAAQLTAITVAGVSSVSNVAMGSQGTCYISGGAVSCFGANNYGSFGTGTASFGYQATVQSVVFP